MDLSQRSFVIAIALVLLVAGIGLGYSDSLNAVFVKAPQACEVDKCVYGFDSAGQVLCRPCTGGDGLTDCTWEKESFELDRGLFNFSYDLCVSGEDYSGNGKTCVFGVEDTSESCWWFSGTRVNVKKAVCRDGKWVEGVERFCKKGQ